MLRTTPLASLLLLTASLSACMFLDKRYTGEVPPPNPPTFCYETLGRAACYDEPQFGMGDLINAQVPPVVVQPAPVIVAPAPVAVVAPPTIIEEPVIVRNPDPYPEPGDRAAPVPLRAY